MITVKAYELYASQEAFAKLIECDFPIMTSYRIMRIAQRVSPELQALEGSRVALLKRYGAQESNGEYRIPPESATEASRELTEVMNSEIVLDVEPLPVSALMEPDSTSRARLRPRDMIALSWMIAEAPHTHER